MHEFDNLFYHYKGPNKDTGFSGYNDAKSLFDMIKNKGNSLPDAEKNQADLKLGLSDIKVGDRKSSAQKKVIKNAENFYDGR